MTSRRLQIVLPGLFDLPLDELEPEFLRNGLPGLNHLLRFATTRENRRYTLDAMLQGALGMSSGASLPLAQAWADSARADDRLLLFEAVHLHPDLHSAVLVPIEKSKENLQDINNIINDLKVLFKVDCDIKTVAEGVFLMRLHGFDAPDHYPHILSVLGKTANPYMEQSRTNLDWYRLLNEMQMFMHQHAVNEQRLRQGKPALNSLWFWGGGRRVAAPENRPEWVCDDPLLNRFATSLGLPPRPLSEVQDLQREAVVVDLRLQQALKTSGDSGLDEILRVIDRELFAPAQAVAAQRGLSLLLRAGFEADFELSRQGRFRFWRRARSLADLGPSSAAVSG